MNAVKSMPAELKLDFTSHEVQHECEEIVFGVYSDAAREIENLLNQLNVEVTQDYCDETYARVFTFENATGLEALLCCRGAKWEVNDNEVVIPRTDLVRTYRRLCAATIGQGFSRLDGTPTDVTVQDLYEYERAALLCTLGYDELVGAVSDDKIMHAVLYNTDMTLDRWNDIRPVGRSSWIRQANEAIVKQRQTPSAK